MQIRVGCEFRYEASWPTPAVIQVQPRADAEHHVLQEMWETSPEVSIHSFLDIYHNICQRLVIAGLLQVTTAT